MPNFFLSHKRPKVAGRMPRLSCAGRPARPGFEASAPRSGPRTAGFTGEVAAGTKSEKMLGAWGRYRSDCAMKLFTGWVVSAGLVVMATAANAQVLAPHETGRSPYAAVSDIEGPYAAMPAEVPAPRYGPALLPPTEVYTILRESGFLPLGIPQQRGLVYTISVIDRGGDDGRL